MAQINNFFPANCFHNMDIPNKMLLYLSILSTLYPSFPTVFTYIGGTSEYSYAASQ